jgi:hypothetical protein
LRTTFDASSDGEDFFIFFSCNPLKSPDSTKENQGNPSLFAWFYLVLFGFICSEFARWLNRSAGRGPCQAVFTAVGWDISCRRGQEVLQEAVETAQKKPEATVTPQRSKRLLQAPEKEATCRGCWVAQSTLLLARCVWSPAKRGAIFLNGCRSSRGWFVEISSEIVRWRLRRSSPDKEFTDALYVHSQIRPPWSAYAATPGGDE